MNFISFLCIQTQNDFVSRLFIPMPVKMTGACQSVKGSCNLSIEPQLTSFLVFHNLPYLFTYRVSFDMMISVIRKIPDRSLDANARNTTAVKITGSTIL